MKILIVGSNNIHAIENHYAKYFTEFGVSVDIFNAQIIFQDYYYKNIFNKIIYKCGVSLIHKKINLLFKQRINEFQPDIVFVFKGMEITPTTLKWLQKLGIRSSNFNPDNPFIFSGKGSGNKNVTNSIELYDVHFTYNTSVMKRLQADYKVPVRYIPFGFELDNILYSELEKEKEILKVCFVGNPDKHRAHFMEELAAQGIKIDIYGNHWKRFVTHHNITLLAPIKEAEFWKVLRRYRVQLNLMRIHNPESHNMRSFEVPGAGGIMLCTETEEHKTFFEVGKEIFVFSDLKDCVVKINYLLNLDKPEADNIRSRARATSLEKGYTYKDRAKQVLESFKQLWPQIQ